MCFSVFAINSQQNMRKKDEQGAASSFSEYRMYVCRRVCEHVHFVCIIEKLLQCGSFFNVL